MNVYGAPAGERHASTVCVRVDDALAARVAFPPYAAAIEWAPTDSDEMIKRPLRVVADPVVSRLEVPMTMEPSRNVTVPVGVAPLDVTVAVNVTDNAYAEGFSEESSVVVVGERLRTVTVTAGLFVEAHPLALVTVRV